MKLESFKSELFNNEIEKPELITGGRLAGTYNMTICELSDGSTCTSFDGRDSGE